MREKESVSITLKKDQIKELEKITEKTGMKRSTLVQQAVEGIIDKYREQQLLPITFTTKKN